MDRDIRSLQVHRTQSMHLRFGEETHNRPTSNNVCSCSASLMSNLPEIVPWTMQDHHWLRDIHKNRGVPIIQDGVDSLLHTAVRRPHCISPSGLPLVSIARSSNICWYTVLVHTFQRHGNSLVSKVKRPSIWPCPSWNAQEVSRRITRVYTLVSKLLSQTTLEEGWCLDNLMSFLAIRNRERTAVQHVDPHLDGTVAQCYRDLLVGIPRPMDVFSPDMKCASIGPVRCESLLRHSLFHAHNTSLCIAIANQQRTGGILPKIMEHLCTPCPRRLPSREDHLADMLRQLLKAGFSFPHNQNPLSRAMKIPDMDLLLAILKTLLDAGIRDIHKSDRHLSRPLYLLAGLPASIKFRAAELLLQHDTSLAYFGVSEDTMASSVWNLSLYGSEAHQDHLRHRAEWVL